MARFTTIGLRRMTKPGRYSDGTRSGLWLQVRGPENRSWLFRYSLDGRRTDMGLGHVDAVSLAEARELAAAARRLVREGIDPIQHRREAKRERRAALIQATFRQTAELLIKAQAPGWRNAKHTAQWEATLTTYVYPVFGERPITTIDTSDVLRALEPIWTTKPETASRVRGRIEAVLDYAKARGWRSGENPARWRGHLAHMLAARSKVARVEHHAALPWRDMPAFMAELAQQPGIAAKALQFAILTAARTGEVIGATWAEVDLAQAVWTIPAGRMKAGSEHRVPLSDSALSILRELAASRVNQEPHVFPGGKLDRGLSGMAMLALLRRMERPGLTTHGFRSTFRDWCAEAIACPREVAEKALAHTIGDKVEAAYRRGDLFDKRRSLMADWATWCGGAEAQ